MVRSFAMRSDDSRLRDAYRPAAHRAFVSALARTGRPVRRGGAYLKDFEPQVRGAFAKGLDGGAIGQKRHPDVAAARAGRLGRSAKLLGQRGRGPHGGRPDGQRRRPVPAPPGPRPRHAAASTTACPSPKLPAPTKRVGGAVGSSVSACRDAAGSRGGQRLDGPRRRRRWRVAARRSRTTTISTGAAASGSIIGAPPALPGVGACTPPYTAAATSAPEPTPALRRPVGALGQREQRSRRSPDDVGARGGEGGADGGDRGGGAGAEAQLLPVRRERRACRSAGAPSGSAGPVLAQLGVDVRREARRLGDQGRRGGRTRPGTARLRSDRPRPRRRCRRRARAYSPTRNSLPGASTIRRPHHRSPDSSRRWAPGPGRGDLGAQNPPGSPPARRRPPPRRPPAHSAFTCGPASMVK